MTRTIYLAAALLSVAAACGGKARGPEAYRADTENLLGMQNDKLRSCYDQALATDGEMAGTVKVHFVVAKKTGVITNAKLDPSSTAPEPLGNCVLQALEGLKLEPPDRNEGRATFVYAFQPQPTT